MGGGQTDEETIWLEKEASYLNAEAAKLAMEAEV